MGYHPKNNKIILNIENRQCVFSFKPEYISQQKINDVGLKEERDKEIRLALHAQRIFLLVVPTSIRHDINLRQDDYAKLCLFSGFTVK